jgi:hypothetical protein
LLEGRERCGMREEFGRAQGLISLAYLLAY